MRPLKVAPSFFPPTLSGSLTLFHERLTVLGDVEFIWQSSPDLIAWEPVEEKPVRLFPGRDASLQRVRKGSPAPKPAGFYRLVVRR
jgi:hypothetical protein